MKILQKPWATFLLLIILGFATYSNHKIFYSGDFISFASEQHVYSDFKQYLFEILSFNRTRHDAPGDYYLFRPVYHGLHALYDHYLRAEPQIQIFLALCFHILSSFLIFLIIKRFFTYPLSLLSAICYLVQVSTTQTLYSVHFHFYLLTNFYVLLALYLLLRTPKPGFFTQLASLLLFFFAGGSHEAAFLGFFIMGFTLHKLKIPLLSFRLIAALILLFISIDLTSYFYYKTPLLGIGDNRVIWNVIGDFFISPFYFSGMHISGLLFGHLRNALIGISNLIYIPLGFFVFFKIIQYLKRNKASPLKDFSTPQKQLFIFTVAMLLAFMTSICLGRGAFRGLNYLRWAIWDDYLLSPYWIILGAFTVNAVFTFPKKNVYFSVLVILWVAQNMSTSWHMQYSFYAPPVAVAKKAWQFFKDPNNCYKGSASHKTEVYLPSPLFKSFLCKGTGTPTELLVNDKNELVIIQKIK